MTESSQFAPPNPNAIMYGTDLQSANRAFQQEQASKQGAVEANPYDKIFDPTYDMSGLTVSGAETMRTRNLATIVSSIPEDEWGMKRFIKGEKEPFEEFSRSLKVYGIETEPPSSEDIDRGIRIAKGRVDTGTSSSFLASQEYISGKDIKDMTRGAKKHVVVWGERSPLYIKPEMIVSAGDVFSDWSGRAVNVQKSYETPNGKKINGTTMDAIRTYATEFDTQLPELEINALNLVLRKEGPVFYVNHSTNRTAAAKLREEPLRFTSLVIHDNR